MKSARTAFKSWSQTPYEKRKEYLQKFSDALMSYEEEFTELLGKENGKPRVFANGEVKAMAAFIGWHSTYPTAIRRSDNEIMN